MRRYLVVGAGAVGQVYGYHLHAGGGSVGFMVKEKYAKDLKEKPLALERLGWFRSQKIRFGDFEVIDKIEDIGKGRWDYIILTIPSNALQEGNWLKRFAAALDSHSTIVSLSSGIEDRELLLSAGLSPERLIDGFISFIAWQAPIPGERFHPIKTLPSPSTNQPIGYFLLPGAMPFSGPPSTLEPLLKDLNRGGLPSLKLPYFNTMFAAPSLVTPLLVALEVEDWSLKRLSKSSLLPVALAASGEALVITGRKMENPFIGFLRFFLWTTIIKVLLLLIPFFPLFDIEGFLKYHFKKVGKQTRTFLDEYKAEGQAYRLPTNNIETLAKKNQRWSAQND